MNFSLKAGVAVAAIGGGLALSAPAMAADLGYGSVKDGYIEAMPELVRTAAGPCYFRADVGYSWSRDADITWAQTDPNSLNYLTSDVRTLNSDGGAFGEVGTGCSWGGSRGIRGEVMFGFRGSRKVNGEPATTWFSPDGYGPDPDPTNNEQDPLHTSVKSYTLMLNLYKDLGQFGRITPYIGAGIGAAYNKMDEVYFTGNPALVNRIQGNSDLLFAWSVMAGVGYQITDRAILDVGYRYIDLGSIESSSIDSAQFYNPPVKLDDLASHEIRVGLRYHFGSSDCCAQPFAMK